MEVESVRKPLFVLEPRRSVSLDFRELWDYRELFYFMVWRDIKVRYKQTLLGVAWAILQPFATMVVFSVLFGYLGKLPSEGAPYPLSTYAALLPWQLFANSLSSSANSLILNERLITKIYFPRLIVPISAVSVALVDFGIGFIVFIGLMLYYRTPPTLSMLTFPLFVLLTLATALAVGLWLSALNVQYRDVRQVLPFLTQLWLFVTPVAYAITLVPERWRLIYGLNPMVGAVEGSRWALLGHTTSPTIAVATSAAVTILMLFGGLRYFKRMERTFADVI